MMILAPGRAALARGDLLGGPYLGAPHCKLICPYLDLCTYVI